MAALRPLRQGAYHRGIIVDLLYLPISLPLLSSFLPFLSIRISPPPFPFLALLFPSKSTSPSGTSSSPRPEQSTLQRCETFHRGAGQCAQPFLSPLFPRPLCVAVVVVVVVSRHYPRGVLMVPRYDMAFVTYDPNVSLLSRFSLLLFFLSFFRGFKQRSSFFASLFLFFLIFVVVIITRSRFGREKGFESLFAIWASSFSR